MNRLALCFVVLAACKSREEPPPAPPPPAPATPVAAPIDTAALLAGKLPEGAPETDLINAQCRICHTVEYLTQQRLGEPAWKRTIEKMRKFGANLSDADAAALVAFAAKYWKPDLPQRTWTLVAPPKGALPAR